VFDIAVPQLNANDVSYVLVEWLCADGERVATGAAVATVETSKAVEEIVAGGDGVLRQLVAPGSEFVAGTVIGRLLPVNSAPASAAAVPAVDPDAEDTAAPILTDAARELVRRYDVTDAEIRSTGRTVVRQHDIEDILAGRRPGPPSRRYELSTVQRRVAQVVTRAHREIPSAFVAVKVHADAALAALADIAETPEGYVGLPELLVRIIGQLPDEFPLAFASRDDDSVLVLADRAHVAVTIDAGTGLFTPVIPDAGALSISEIADRLMEVRMKALRGSFTVDDLTGANITLSLHNEPDVVMAQPIVFPGQTCILSLCGTQTELVRTDGGDLASRQYFLLGLTYDHRVINGREATRLLRQVKTLCEDASRLTGLVRP